MDHYEYSEKSDTVRYNAKWTYYWQSTPTFSVTQLVNNQPVDYLGEFETEIKGANGAESEVITLYDKATANYFFGKPVFQQGNRYAFRFNAYEAYTNYTGESPIIVTYPVTGGQVDLANNLQVDPQPETIDLDSTGVAVYTFMAGAPNLTDGYSDFFATLNLGAISYFWNLGQQPVEAWQLGEKSTGTNFMTSGPDQLTAILRDPPGSGSYAYIEKGTSVTSTTSNSISHSVAEEAKLTTKLGAEIITFVGIGAGVITKAETKGDIVAGLSSEQTYSYDTESETTTTFTERFETSGEADYVGAVGDVFIGNSTNLLYGLTNGVKVYRGEVTGSPYATQGDYKIAPSSAIAYGQEFATRFAFTAMELEDIMIPKWEQSIILRLQPVGTVVDAGNITAPVYVSKLQPDDADYGKWNLDEIFKSNPAFDRQEPYDGASYKIYFPSTWTQMGEEMKNFQDSILWARNQIGVWKTVLTQNEKEKAEMKLKGNYSFGGGATIEYSEATDSVSSYNSSFGFNLSPSLGTAIGGEVMGIGLEVEANVEYRYEDNTSEGETTEKSKTTGFVLSEEGTTDEITVDYGLTASGTFAFKTRGGQTSCPYEGAVLSRYFEPGQHILSEATMQIEVPVINLSSASQVLNVPANRAATFTLAMQNESETGTDVWFQLVVDESTNPNGAELKIDGIGIGNGRMFSVPAGQTLTKTLTMNKGTVDDYENIGIILQSLCQPDEIADTAYISARFVPACSDVRIVQPANNFILNTESATGKTLNVTLQDFDVNFPNFGYIRLEYRPVNSPNWNEITTFYPSALYANAQGTKEDIGDRASLTYGWDMPDADGQYELRATTASVNIKNGNEIDGEPLSTFTTEAVTGYKDMKKPQALGLPSPANGILGAGDELSVTFNENINTGMLIRDNLSITYNGGTDVAFDFVASSNKITFDFPSDWFSVLERQNIEVEVKDVQDMHGNKCEPITWSAYVHRNALVWDNEEISLIKEAGETLSFTAKIKNAGGSAVSYQVASLPWWLSVSSSVGNLQPLQSKELTFSISQGVNIGKYAENIGLTSGNDVVEQLPVNLNVTAIRPDWSVNPANYESTMTITGQIRIEGTPRQDDTDILAAFIGDECTGLVSPIYVEELNSYFTFFTIYGNSAHAGKEITLKLWDASTGNIYSSVVSTLSGATQNLTFSANAMKGSTSAPVIHNALNIIEQSIALANGWSWVSVNVTNSNPANLLQFTNSIGAAGELLKGQNGYIQSPSWTGSLASIENEKMYLVKTGAATALRFTGQAADAATSPITLTNGWNWIGYIPQFTLPTNEALAGLTPQLGDQIKGQSGYRTYTGAANGWIGSLSYMRPGEGYMYYSGASVGKSFNYLSSASQTYRIPELRKASMPAKNHWTTNVYKYPNTMTMTSVVMLNGKELQSDRIEIAAFAGEECRGSIILQHVEENSGHPYLGFLLIFGEGGETLTVKVYDHASGTEYTASSQVTFTTDAINGNSVTPYQISVSANTGVDDITLQAITLYPNPAETVLNIDYAADKLDWLRIADVTGRIVLSEPDFNKKSVNVGGWAKGVYLMSITVNGNTKVYRFIKE